jgi:hypothetical protein
MKLIAYPTAQDPPQIRPAAATRPWLDRLPAAFGYRCLPLNIANSHGWELVCPTGFEAVWRGGTSPGSIEVKTDGDGRWGGTSHFGSGILTFHAGYLFRTEPGWNIYVTGPTNAPRDGIAPLTGVVETDWAPYTFTMNWAFTRPDVPVRFEAGEAFCFFFPTPREALEAVEPEIRDMAEEPETQDRYHTWISSRAKFIRELRDPESVAAADKWQKRYYRGEWPEGGKAREDHRIKLTLKPFSDHRRKQD